MSEGKLAGAFASSMATARQAVEIPRGEGTLTLFVRELGYLEMQEAYAQARANQQSALGLLVSLAVEDADGNRFTYAEAMRLRRDVSAPLFTEVARVNRIGEGAEKN